MPELNEAKEVDVLNIPDDELPDYPPGDEPEDNTAASDESADTANENEDINDDDEEESNDGEIEGNSEDETENGEDSESGSEATDDEEGNPEQIGDETSEDTTAEQEELDSEASKEAAKPTKAKTKAKGKGTAKATEKTLSPGSEAQLQQLFAPFKANGRDMQVSSVEDAVTLMKMGANYNKKMQGLKPNLRLMKMLENNKLLDEEKLSFLIDLQNKNPAAIAKLVKDSGFDTMDHDEDNTDYTPGTYTVNEKEVDLDMVLEEIKDTPSFQKTIDTISNKWDAASRKLVQDDPSIIRVINGHVDNGMYDQIMDIVQNEKALGRLTEMSDLQAYKHVGDTLQADGAFAEQPQANGKQPTQKKPQDPKLKNRKKAAANTRSKPTRKQGVIDPLSLSDEDFAKLDPALV